MGGNRPDREPGLADEGTLAHWFHGLPSVAADIACDGERHRITWRRGRLILEDHDALAEQSLTALGARPPLCVELLDAWRTRRDIELLHELLLGENTLSPAELAMRKSRHESEVESAKRMPHHTMARHGSRPGGARKVGLAERQAAERLDTEKQAWAATLTEALPPELRKPLALSMIVNLERHWHRDDFRARHQRQVESVLTALAAPLLEQSTQGQRRKGKRPRGIVTEAALLAPGEEARCEVWDDRRHAHATVSLPLAWFIDVWARGIAVVDGYFVLAVELASPDGKELRVRAVRLRRWSWRRWRSIETSLVLTRRGHGDWQLGWA